MTWDFNKIFLSLRFLVFNLMRNGTKRCIISSSFYFDFGLSWVCIVERNTLQKNSLDFNCRIHPPYELKLLSLSLGFSLWSYKSIFCPQSFREGKFNVLLTTDVAARGLDIPEVDLVIQCNPPEDVDSYIHRSGRTGRAGKNGVCICFYKPEEEMKLANVEYRAVSVVQFMIL